MLARRIEEAAINSWPALQQHVLDGWNVRCADGYTRRANSVTPLYPSQLPAASKVAYCEALYRARSLPPIFRLTSAQPDAALEALLTERGYLTADPTEVLYLPLAQLAVPSSACSDAQALPIPVWLREFARLAGAAPEAFDCHRAILDSIMGDHAGLALSVDGTTVACGLSVLDHECCGLFDVVTAPTLRRRGYGRQLVAALLDWGRERGAAHFYLQVLASNMAARRLYASFGFQPLDTYRYWVAPR